VPALLFAGKAKPEQGRFNARKVGGGTRIGGAEYSGGRGGHGVAGTLTAGIRNGTFPFRVILIDAPLRSSVNTMPLYSCRQAGLRGLRFGRSRRSNSGLAVVGVWVPARERSGGQVEMGGREGATARVSRRLWNGCGPAAPPNVEGRAKRSPND